MLEVIRIGEVNETVTLKVQAYKSAGFKVKTIIIIIVIITFKSLMENV